MHVLIMLYLGFLNHIVDVYGGVYMPVFQF